MYISIDSSSLYDSRFTMKINNFFLQLHSFFYFFFNENRYRSNKRGIRNDSLNTILCSAPTNKIDSHGGKKIRWNDPIDCIFMGELI